MTRLPSFDLKGEVALVTGASSGIGRHLAKLLAAAGAKVGLAARRADLLAGVASDIAAAGGESLPITCDVTRLDSVTAAVAKAESELGQLTILVNALAPGYVETDFNRAFFQTEAGKALISRIPLKRLGQTEDLDGALLFLASPASAYVTGAVVAVDGGHGVAAI